MTSYQQPPAANNTNRGVTVDDMSDIVKIVECVSYAALSNSGADSLDCLQTITVLFVTADGERVEAVYDYVNTEEWRIRLASPSGE